MPSTTRTRAIAASPEEIWKVVGDPHHLPRWWPRMERVEHASAGEFTEVLRSDRGRVVRADQRIVELEDGSLIAWEQSLEGTPFERVLREMRTAVRVRADGASSVVELERRQKLKGMARLGGFLARRATARLLDEALERLASITE